MSVQLNLKPGTRGTRDFASDDRSELGFSSKPSQIGSSDNISRADDVSQGANDPVITMPTTVPEQDAQEDEQEEESSEFELPEPKTEEELGAEIEQKLGGFVRRQTNLMKTKGLSEIEILVNKIMAKF